MRTLCRCQQHRNGDRGQVDHYISPVTLRAWRTRVQLRNPDFTEAMIFRRALPWGSNMSSESLPTAERAYVVGLSTLTLKLTMHP